MTDTISYSELVFDFDLYPRTEVDGQHVHYLHQALESGSILPPILVDKKSRRVIDGFHRARAWLRYGGEDVKIPVVEKEYSSDSKLFMEAMSCNSSHGRQMTTHDRVHCLVLAERMGVSDDLLAGILHVPPETLQKLRTERLGKMRTRKGSSRGKVPLKRTIKHMAGRTLSASQIEANKKLGGSSQTFYARQLILILENDFLDKDDEILLGLLRKLSEMIIKIT